MKCSHCDERVATCVGRYDNMADEEPACDECCGHGCEDGRCVPIEDYDHELAVRAIGARRRRLLTCEHRRYARRSIPSMLLARTRPWLLMQDSPLPWHYREWARVLRRASPSNVTIVPTAVH